MWEVLTTYNKEQTMKLFWEEGYEEGYAEGLEIGRRERLLPHIRMIMEEHNLTALQAMSVLGISESEQPKYLEMI